MSSTSPTTRRCCWTLLLAFALQLVCWPGDLSSDGLGPGDDAGCATADASGGGCCCSPQRVARGTCCCVDGAGARARPSDGTCLSSARGCGDAGRLPLLRASAPRIALVACVDAPTRSCAPRRRAVMRVRPLRLSIAPPVPPPRGGRRSIA
ncbi:MAG: hypothetical protein H6825_13665 [Planctomycetes bacterium]|nr:hypothetical protein [Planctomycetota bacterium]